MVLVDENLFLVQKVAAWERCVCREALAGGGSKSKRLSKFELWKEKTLLFPFAKDAIRGPTWLMPVPCSKSSKKTLRY